MKTHHLKSWPERLPELRRLLNYDPGSGMFRWKVHRFRVNVGDEAGCVSTTTGYRSIKVFQTKIDAQLLAVLFMTGSFPTNQVDHKNGNRADNSWCNLRPATSSQNKWNAKKHRDNTSGFKGVSKSRSKWTARISKNYKQIFLGGFATPEAAHQAYCEAATQLFGEFASEEGKS